MRVNPFSLDIATSDNLNAVKLSLTNLCKLIVFDKPFHPEIGINLRSYLFEPADAITLNMLRRNMTAVLEAYEPRVNIYDLEFSLDPENQQIEIKLHFSLKQSDRIEVIEIFLERIR